MPTPTSKRIYLLNIDNYAAGVGLDALDGHLERQHRTGLDPDRAESSLPGQLLSTL